MLFHVIDGQNKRNQMTSKKKFKKAYILERVDCIIICLMSDMVKSLVN